MLPETVRVQPLPSAIGSSVPPLSVGSASLCTHRIHFAIHGRGFGRETWDHVAHTHGEGSPCPSLLCAGRWPLSGLIWSRAAEGVHAERDAAVHRQNLPGYVLGVFRARCEFRRRRTLIPEGTRTAFRAEGEQSSERSDAGTSIVQEVFGFVKEDLSGALRR